VVTAVTLSAEIRKNQKQTQAFPIITAAC